MTTSDPGFAYANASQGLVVYTPNGGGYPAQTTGKLLVFLPCHDAQPGGYEALMRQAADQYGYHVIGLPWYNSNEWTYGNPDDSSGEDCFG